MNKFVISDEEYGFGHGYLGVILTELDKIDKTLNDILCFDKVIITHIRSLEHILGGYECKEIKTKIEYKKYYIHLYPKPDNRINQIEWCHLTINQLKSNIYQYYTEILYNGKTLYIGLKVPFNNLVQNVELYATELLYPPEPCCSIVWGNEFDLMNNKIVNL